MQHIVLNNICKKFGEKIILDNFNMQVNKGEFLSIMGESGKGKTTLLNIIGMLEKADSGELIIKGHRNLSFSSPKAIKLRRYDISYLFQNYGLIDNETVLNNLKIVTKYQKSKNEKNDIINALDRVGLSGIEKRKVFTLSGGEQQRVALAKIILKSPEIILADEPTGSLDYKNRDYVLEILKNLNEEGKTVIVVTHDSCVEKCAKRNIYL